MSAFKPMVEYPASGGGLISAPDPLRTLRFVRASGSPRQTGSQIVRMIKARREAARRESFRQMAKARDADALPSDFDRDFAAWQRRRRRRAVAAIFLTIATLLAGVALLIRVSPVVAQDACLDDGGRWISGQCEGGRSGN
jgi:hypothetical protein